MEVTTLPLKTLSYELNLPLRNLSRFEETVNTYVASHQNEVQVCLRILYEQP